jgi:hypothetical protein
MSTLKDGDGEGRFRGSFVVQVGRTENGRTREQATKQVSGGPGQYTAPDSVYSKIHAPHMYCTVQYKYMHRTCYQYRTHTQYGPLAILIPYRTVLNPFRRPREVVKDEEGKSTNHRRAVEPTEDHPYSPDAVPSSLILYVQYSTEYSVQYCMYWACERAGSGG